LVEPLTQPSNDNQRPRSGWQRLRDADMIAALAAVLVGLCALAVSIYQSMLMREQQQASVWPHVEIGREYRRDGDKRVFKFIVENTGIGPARIKNLRVRLDGKVQADWASLIKALGVVGENVQNRSIVTSSTVSNRVLLPGSSIQALVVEDEAVTKPLEAATSDTPPRLDIEICYCSIYDRCYRISYAGKEETAASCPADPALDFRE
jgi:hypothetical protein